MSKFIIKAILKNGEELYYGGEFVETSPCWMSSLTQAKLFDSFEEAREITDGKFFRKFQTDFYGHKMLPRMLSILDKKAVFEIAEIITETKERFTIEF